MILDILSTCTFLYILSIAEQYCASLWILLYSVPSLFYCFQYPYCPLDTLFLLFTLLLSILSVVLDLDSLLFYSVVSHAIVLHLDNSIRMYK